jgi:hypothetical protein
MNTLQLMLDKGLSAFNKLKSAERFVTVLPFGETIPATPYNAPENRAWLITVTAHEIGTDNLHAGQIEAYGENATKALQSALANGTIQIKRR